MVTTEHKLFFYQRLQIAVVMQLFGLHIYAQTDISQNYVHTVNYDENGKVIGESKAYYDNLGRSTQSQSRVISDNNVVAQQTLYDEYGRKVIETLPASIQRSTLGYKPDFITLGNTNAPIVPNNQSATPVGSSVAGSLGYYYSNSNAAEPYVPASGYPYSRIKYDDNNPGTVKQSSSPGEALRMGSGHETQSYSMVSLNEVDFLYGQGKSWVIENYTDVANNGQGTITPGILSGDKRVIKTITVDANGQEMVTFTSPDGKTLASCLSGQVNGANAETRTLSYTQAGTASLNALPGAVFIDVHLPKGCEQSLVITNKFTSGANNAPVYQILDLKAGAYVTFGGSSNFSGTQPNLSPGYYRIIWLRGGRAADGAFSFQISQQVNYYNFSINYYDAAGRLKLTVPPAGVDKTYTPSSNLPNHKMIGSTNYNSLGQVQSSVTSDAGLTNFIYRDDGRIRFSQNAKQAVAKGLQTISTSTVQTTYILSVSNQPGYSSYNNYYFQYIFPSTILQGKAFNVTLNFVVGPGGDVPALRSNYTARINPTSDFTALVNSYPYLAGSWVNFKIPSTVPSTIVPVGQIIYSTTFSVQASISTTHIQFAQTGFQVTNAGTGITSGAAAGALTASSIVENTQVTSPAFSYINYDNTGRIIETGEYNPNTSTAATPLSFAPTYANTPTDAGGCSQQSYTLYDTGDITYMGYQQHYLLGKVSKTWNANSTTWYSYDELGRIEWTVQKINNMPATNQNKYITINYAYDLSGNVTRVAYQQENANEDFYYYYQYDADKRLKRMLSSTDGQSQQEQAAYYYYKHGPLKRVELANKVQGLDYVYTINGWLKSINSPELNERDPGKDGMANNNGIYCPKDIFGMSLDYFSAAKGLPGDYTRTNTNIQTYGSGQNYFNGLIKDQRWQTTLPVDAQSNTNIQYKNSQLYYGYTYDNQYRLTAATFAPVASAGTLNNNVANAGAGPLLASSTNNYADYKIQGITYDLNGNINKLNRYGYTTNSNGANMDKLVYNYNVDGSNKLLNNKLKNVTDSVANSSGSDSYGSFGFNAGQTTGSSNYLYDEIGQQVGDNNPTRPSQTIYDVYGKVTAIDFTAPGAGAVSFLYDEKGNRIKKSDGSTDTWYLRDASGNVISIYQNTSNSGALVQTEVGLYADNRIGAYYPTSGATGSYLYEITDHLGNVRTTFTKVFQQQVIYTSFDGKGKDDPIFNYSLANVDKTVDRGGNLTKGSLKLVYIHTVPAQDNTILCQKIPVRAGQVITGSFWAYCAIHIPGASGFGLCLTDIDGNMRGGELVNSMFNNPSEWAKTLFKITVQTDGYFYLIAWDDSDKYPIWIDDLTIDFGPGGGAPSPQVQSFADYYPHGSVMPGRNYTSPQGYRYGYQGQYCETDPETGLDNFEARMYDPLLGRWNTTDPAGQHFSPYVSMGNNPVCAVDPNGQWDGWDDVAAMLVGGISNVISNWDNISHSAHPWAEGFEDFGVGVVAGEVALYDPAAGFAVGGELNLSVQAANGHVNTGEQALQAFIGGGLSGLSGGEAGLETGDKLAEAGAKGYEDYEVADGAKGFHDFLNPEEGKPLAQTAKYAYAGSKNVLAGYASDNYNFTDKSGWQYWHNAVGDFASGLLSNRLSDLNDNNLNNKFDYTYRNWLNRFGNLVRTELAVTSTQIFINTAISTPHYTDQDLTNQLWDSRYDMLNSAGSDFLGQSIITFGSQGGKNLLNQALKER